MGTSAPDARDGEAPPRRARVAPFLIDAKAVSNEQFREFTRDTKFKT